MNKKVLIINNTWANPVMAGFLAENGYEVTSVRGARGGLYRLESGQYHVIIVRESPLVESWRLCDRIRTLSDAPLIVISPNAPTEVCVRAINAGADYFMRKSFGRQELLARIKSLLQRQTMKQPVLAVR